MKISLNCVILVFRGCVHDVDASVCDEGSCQKCESVKDGCNSNHAPTSMSLSRFCLILLTIMFFFSLFDSSSFCRFMK